MKAKPINSAAPANIKNPQVSEWLIADVDDLLQEAIVPKKTTQNNRVVKASLPSQIEVKRLAAKEGQKNLATAAAPELQEERLLNGLAESEQISLAAESEQISLAAESEQISLATGVAPDSPEDVAPVQADSPPNAHSRSHLNVDMLFDDLELQAPDKEAAGEENFILTDALAEEHIDRLNRVLHRIKSQPDGSIEWCREMDNARIVLSDEAEFLSKLQKTEHPRREELLDCYFRLRRIVESRGNREEPRDDFDKKSFEKITKELLKERPAAQLQPKKRFRLQRKQKMLIIFGTLLILRLAYLPFELSFDGKQNGAGFQKTPELKGSHLALVHHPSTENSNQPTVESLVLIQSPGGLTALAVARDYDSPSITYDFIWVDNGQPLKNEQVKSDTRAQVLLDKVMLQAGHHYQVKLQVSDGKNLSKLEVTAPLMFQPSQTAH